MQHSTRVRNAVVNAVTSTINAASASASPTLQFRTGGAPASCSSPATGTLLGTITISSPGWMGAGSSGSASLTSSLSGKFSADGTIGHYRIVAGDGQCDEQGSVSISGGGGDLQLPVATLGVVAGQPITISSRSITGTGA